MRCVALVRAGNIGGRKVTMRELKSAVGGLGYDNVRTFIVSGNLAFDTK